MVYSTSLRPWRLKMLSCGAGTIFVLALMWAASVCWSAVAQPAPSPNVILIVADDLGYADVGFHADIVAPQVRTPHLDRIARSGMTFRSAYANCPVCSPSRLAISTGRYPQRWGAYWFGEGGLPPDELTLAQALRQRGHRTMKIGKVHLNGGPVEHPLDHGFDEFLGFQFHSWDYTRLHQRDVDAYEARKPGSTKRPGGLFWFGPLTRGRDTRESYEHTSTTEIFGRESVRFIQENKARPFYLQVEFNAVHTPLTIVPESYEKRFPIVQPKWDPKPDAATWPYPFWDPLREDYARWYGNANELGILDPHGRLKYLANLAALDDAVGAILDAVEKQGLRENTLIVFTSDNGGSHQSYANNGPLHAYKFSVREGGIRVPLAISLPGKVRPGTTSHALVSHMDLLPTVMELVGGNDVKNLDGKSWMPLFADPSKQIHDALFFDIGRQGSWAVRQGDWKLSQISAYKFESYPRVRTVNGIVDLEYKETLPLPLGTHLYDLGTDIGETTDVSGSFKAKAAELEARYRAWRSQMAPPTRTADKYK